MDEHLPGLAAGPIDCADFDAFWARYPNKQGKAPARKRWAKMTPVERRDATEAVGLWCEFWALAHTEQRFIPHGSTWLNQSRWEDEVPDLPATPMSRPRGWAGLDALQAAAAQSSNVRAIGR